MAARRISMMRTGFNAPIGAQEIAGRGECGVPAVSGDPVPARGDADDCVWVGVGHREGFRRLRLSATPFNFLWAHWFADPCFLEGWDWRGDCDTSSQEAQA
jgi:hypothetical protein